MKTNKYRKVLASLYSDNWHIMGPEGLVYDSEPYGKDKVVVIRGEDEVDDVVEKMNVFDESKKCSVCSADLVEANIGDGSIDTYREECGCPDEKEFK